MNAAETPTSYDRVAYPSRPYADAHPQHLAMLARLFGLAAPPLDGGRVLEIGCGEGGHLLPLAMLLPGCTFVGVDPARSAIDAARARADALGLRNVRFHPVSFTEIGSVEPELSHFDYITAHGVYSWIPAPLRTAMLETLRTHLAPEGIAYISYNALPGWRVRGAMREMMRYHTATMTDPSVRVGQARALISFLASAVPGGNEYSALLCSERDRMAKWEDAYLFHDHLSDENTPFWFHEFVADAERAGLRYLAEAHLSTMRAETLDPAIAEVVAGLRDDVIGQEQYLDFLRNRSFRQTLLCHAERSIDRDLTPHRFQEFSFVSRALATSADALPAQFRTPDGIELDTPEPLPSAMLAVLDAHRPRPLRFDELLDRCRDRLGGDLPTREQHAQDLGRHLLQCYAYHGVVRPYSWTARIASNVGTHPEVWSYARAQAADGQRGVTNLLHEHMIVQQEPDFVLLQLCDGRRDLAGLRAAAAEHFPDARNLDAYLDDFLERCRAQALLVEPESFVQSP